ncbi:hypothetical protein SAMN05216480_11810 [Pustulibacterium marinum]|uniref:Esterase n=1 Tax=Pustulibacterium marinum TaxID=1224947 RepID=A0A1I7IMI6_9FLAO|nr:PHB depolymerase family esterase [Pustulibacterium marinum]SFU74135.1 hypothetical protein SAMN05216480_11810 [Pustulibacterium marinum]
MVRSKMILMLLISILVSCTTDKKQEIEAVEKANTEETTNTWDSSYGGVDKSYDTNLLAMRKKVAPTFKTFSFEDKETGVTMEYNLYIPKDYDDTKVYPLVLFMADASTVGKGVKAPLMQGYGGIIWATAEEQAKHPSFVLVPSFKGPEAAVNDDFETSNEVATVLHLLEDVIYFYNVDTTRIYTTGQSMGGMISFYLTSKYPDLFAAELFVGSQWDINVLQPLAKENFFYITSEGDEKASGGMQEVKEMLTAVKVPYTTSKFSAKASEQDKNTAITEALQSDANIHMVQFTKGTVPPSSESRGGAEHMYSFDYAYMLTPARDWLFQQHQ